MGSPAALLHAHGKLVQEPFLPLASLPVASTASGVGVPIREVLVMTNNRIRDLNDRFRRLRQGNGKVFVTAGVQARGPVFVAEAICAVRSFDAFSPDNDPYGERDFGAVVVNNTRLFWKIDYYDPTLSSGSEDPANETQTCRVLTIMMAHEY